MRASMQFWSPRYTNRGALRVFASAAILVLALIALNSHDASAGSRPRLSYVQGRHTVELSPKMNAAIRRFDATFVPWLDEDYLPSIRKYYRYTERQSPFAVLGDVSGDGRIDAILDGRTSSRSVLLAVLSRGGGYRVLVIESGELIDPRTQGYVASTGLEYGKDSCLNYFAPRRIKTSYERLPLYLRHDAFELGYCERASTVYYYRNGRFHTYTTSD